MTQQDPPVSQPVDVPTGEDQAKTLPQEQPAQEAPELITPAQADAPPPARPARGRKAAPAPAAGAIRFEDVVTGQFDADEEDVALAPPKRVLSPQPETPKSVSYTHLTLPTNREV